ncbi:MAG: hypothetical protein J5I59_05460 [Saprospiraceae bacterium]|nr:hypothetical protein [Saprospiraceae bacterium]
MKYLGIALLLCTMIYSCNEEGDKMAPGERYTVDTLMFHEYRTIDSQVQVECNKITQEIFKKAYDSLLRIRVKDIRMIKGNGLPPQKNQFPEALNKLERLEHRDDAKIQDPVKPTVKKQ